METNATKNPSYTPDYQSSSAPENDQGQKGGLHRAGRRYVELNLLGKVEPETPSKNDNPTPLSARVATPPAAPKYNALLNSTHYTSDASSTFVETYQKQYDRLGNVTVEKQATAESNAGIKARYHIDNGKLHLTADGTEHYKNLAKQAMNIDASKGKGNSLGSVFTVNEGDINPENLRFGIGKEAFEALISPEYAPVSSDHFRDFKSDDHCLVIKSTREIKSWNLRLMDKHEAVNDTFNGQPILATFCHMGGLAQVFSRTVDGQDLTFGVSGYLYSDQAINEGLFGFLLYDRNTQSLWNPFALKSVGGDLVNQTISPLSETDDDVEAFVLTWQQLQKNYPNAMALLPNQTVKDAERSQFST